MASGSSYFRYPVQLTSVGTGSQSPILTQAWSCSSEAYLAVASADGRVTILVEEVCPCHA